MKRCKFIVFLISFLCSSALASIEYPMRYQVAADYTDPSGATAPLQNTEMGFTEVSASARGSHVNPNYKNTDDRGTVTIVSGDYATFVQRTEFCAKLNGLWYCAPVPQSPPFGSASVQVKSEPMLAHNFWNYPLNNTQYACTAEISQMDQTGSVHMSCRDRKQ